MADMNYATARAEFAQVDAAVTTILAMQTDHPDDVPDQLTDSHHNAMVIMLTAPASGLADIAEKLDAADKFEIARIADDEVRAAIFSAISGDVRRLLLPATEATAA